eukprot:m.237556 g.237556  ORF g.237556 m.237556 type:complete len:72 (+) comp17110_c1_seq1:273-488(+)
MYVTILTFALLLSLWPETQNYTDIVVVSCQTQRGEKKGKANIQVIREKMVGEGGGDQVAAPTKYATNRGDK